MTVTNGPIAGMSIPKAHVMPMAVTVVASNRLIPVLEHAVRIPSNVPPISLTLFAMCMEKSIPTPTRIDPIITVTRDSDKPHESITNHCMATVNPTGIVVRKAYLMSLKTRARVIIVNPSAKAREVH